MCGCSGGAFNDAAKDLLSTQFMPLGEGYSGGLYKAVCNENRAAVCANSAVNDANGLSKLLLAEYVSVSKDEHAVLEELQEMSIWLGSTIGAKFKTGCF